MRERAVIMRFMTVVVRVFDRDDRHSVDGYLRLNLARGDISELRQERGCQKKLVNNIRNKRSNSSIILGAFQAVGNVQAEPFRK